MVARAIAVRPMSRNNFLGGGLDGAYPCELRPTHFLSHKTLDFQRSLGQGFGPSRWLFLTSCASLMETWKHFEQLSPGVGLVHYGHKLLGSGSLCRLPAMVGLPATLPKCSRTQLGPLVLGKGLVLRFILQMSSVQGMCGSSP